mmetsp:Transcript_37173/g.90155  ORF Transcript_37173/g.90155 Transcript_37173/m.90155 type:complete len:88 (+) Transcript_37173:1539-1802(+)
MASCFARLTGQINSELADRFTFDNNNTKKNSSGTDQGRQKFVCVRSVCLSFRPSIREEPSGRLQHQTRYVQPWKQVTRENMQSSDTT